MVFLFQSCRYIKAGKLRALAATTATRFEGAPETSTIGEVVPGYEASRWYGVGAPKNTPAEIVGGLNKEINAVLIDPKIRIRMADLGGTPLSGSPSDFESSSLQIPKSGKCGTSCEYQARLTPIANRPADSAALMVRRGAQAFPGLLSRADGTWETLGFSLATPMMLLRNSIGRAMPFNGSKPAPVPRTVTVP